MLVVAPHSQGHVWACCPSITVIICPILSQACLPQKGSIFGRGINGLNGWMLPLGGSRGSLNRNPPSVHTEHAALNAVYDGELLFYLSSMATTDKFHMLQNSRHGDYNNPFLCYFIHTEIAQVHAINIPKNFCLILL